MLDRGANRQDSSVQTCYTSFKGVIMRIAVVGIGGVGGYIGAKLCALIEKDPKKYDVVFIARGAHADAVASEGIQIIEDDTTFRATPSQVCSVEAADGIFDLIICCVKSYDRDALIDGLKKNIGTDTVIMPLANGVDNALRIEQRCRAKVINAAVYILSHIEKPGVIRKKGKVFAIIFGDRRYVGEALFIEGLFEDAGLRGKRVDDIDTAIWKKYLFISAFATLTSYFNRNIKAVYEDHGTVAKAVLQEIASVAQAKGINLEGEVDKALETASKLPESASTSMHLDFQKGRQSELESLCGYVVKEAKTLHVKVKNMQKMYDALRCGKTSY